MRNEGWWFGMRNGGLVGCVCGARRTMVSGIHPLGLLIRDSVHEIVSFSDARFVDWSTC